MRQPSLPSWATLLASGKIEIDADQFYPALLTDLGAPKELDQYWLEVAFQCAKLDVQHAVSGTDAMPEPGAALLIIVKDDSKASGIWSQTNYPAGKGAQAASEGKEALGHYRRIRPQLV